MPGPVVHTIIAENLPDEFSSNHRNIQSTIDGKRRELVYGAQGPDPFFFNFNDLTGFSVAEKMIKWHNTWGDISYAFYKLRSPLISVSRKINEAGNEAVLEASKHSDIVKQVKNLVIQLRENMFLASKVVNGYVKKMVLDQADPFGFYVSPLQTCGRTKDLLKGAQSPTNGVGGWKDVANLDDWWWFDLLHSRRPGDFVTELLDIALGKKPGVNDNKAQKDRLLSYAIGYLSHLSADVVGHAYVNSLVGGPYRIGQAQRHTAQEKIMDVWAYNHYYQNGFLEGLNGRDDRYYLDGEVVESGMHRNFVFTGGRVEPTQWEPNPKNPLPKKRKKPITSLLKLPDEITKNFTTATSRAYPEDRFGELTPYEVDLAYRGWYGMFRSATNAFGPFEPEELPGDVKITEKLKEELKEAKNELTDIADAAENVGDALTHDGGGNIGNCFDGGNIKEVGESAADCLSDAAEAISNYISNLAEAVANLFKEIGELLYSVYEIVDAAVAVPLRALNYMLRQSYEKLWAAYTHLLKLITSIGFSYMYWEDLQGSQQLNHLYNPQVTDATNVNSPKNTIVKPGQNTSGFPQYGLTLGGLFEQDYQDILKGLENEGHLLVPPDENPKNVEEYRTIPGPDEYGRNTPEVFITDPDGKLKHPFDDGRESPLWEWIAAPSRNTSNPSPRSASTPKLQDYYSERSAGGPEDFTRPVLGDAVSLTVSLFEYYQEYGQVPNLNMSGDRAIGFPTWANKNGCGEIDRERWKAWHGNQVPWLNTPIKPVFVPKVPKKEWDDPSDVPGDVYY